MPPSPNDHSRPHGLKARLSSWFWSLTPPCKEVIRLTSEGRDRLLPFPTRLRLLLHRSFCQWCARYAKQLNLMNEASREFPEHADEIAGPVLDREAKARIKQALQSQADGKP